MFGRCILCVIFTYVSSLLDHDIIKYMMVFFPHYLGCLLYFLNRPCIIYYLRMYTSSVLLVPGYCANMSRLQRPTLHVANRECAFGLSDRGRGGSRLPACILRSSSSVK